MKQFGKDRDERKYKLFLQEYGKVVGLKIEVEYGFLIDIVEFCFIYLNFFYRMFFERILVLEKLFGIWK